jgi:hypothetical protein
MQLYVRSWGKTGSDTGTVKLSRMTLMRQSLIAEVSGAGL